MVAIKTLSRFIEAYTVNSAFARGCFILVVAVTHFNYNNKLFDWFKNNTTNPISTRSNHGVTS